MSAHNNKPPILITYTGKYALWRFINIIIMGALVGGAIFTYCFIYQNIYNTISNTYAITELNSNITWTTLNSQDYDKTQNILQQKSELKPTPVKIRNIFSYGSQTTTTTTTSTTIQ